MDIEHTIEKMSCCEECKYIDWRPKTSFSLHCFTAYCLKTWKPVKNDVISGQLYGTMTKCCEKNRGVCQDFELRRDKWWKIWIPKCITHPRTCE